MIKIFGSLILILSLTACGVNPDKGHRALSNAGYTDIKIGGYAFFGCGKEDNYASKFTATAPSGNHVSGVLCSGLFKGITIRFD